MFFFGRSPKREAVLSPMKGLWVLLDCSPLGRLLFAILAVLGGELVWVALAEPEPERLVNCCAAPSLRNNAKELFVI